MESDELTPAQRDETIAKLSAFVVGRRLEAPVLFMLEASRPLTFLASQTVIVGTPVLAPFFGWERIDRYRLILEDRDNVDRLIARIETDAAKRDAPSAADDAADDGAGAGAREGTPEPVAANGGRKGRDSET